MALLELIGVSKTYSGGIEAVRNCSLSVDDGAFLSILGPSGCGKTTLLKLVAGLIKQTEGSILMDGAEITGPGPDRGVVFQEYTSFPWLSVRENVAFGLRLQENWSEEDIAKKVDALLDEVELEEFSHTYPGFLSGGQQQRVALARSLAVKPRVLLLDEPFGALDAQTRNSMQTLIRKLWNDLGQTMLFITHDIEEAVFLGQEVLVSSTRPFVIREQIYVDLPELRSHHMKLSDEFATFERDIARALRRSIQVELVR